ncbi:MAG: protein translocase subunit SecD [Candidatus Paceibacterota bacterium]|jgi:protein-export membrane protein SecD
MNKTRLYALFLVLVLVGVGYFNYASQFKSGSWMSQFPFKLGLDLAGGTELTYTADVSKVKTNDVKGSLDALRDVIERRVNPNGVGETTVQIENAGVLGNGAEQYRLIVELPGVTRVQDAITVIGQTPVLEFKLQKADAAEILKNNASSTQADLFEDTALTGRFLQNSQVEFDQTTRQPIVSLAFNTEGRELFAKITRENVGRTLAIFLDGEVISAPVIREEISQGTAQISGSFNTKEAQMLVRNLNYGALPVPITLASTQTIGASLGQDALFSGLRAGLWGFAVLILFLILWYRLPGVVASVALVLYVMISLAIFKLVPVTLTAAGIAGFILSIGMAVDANVLIFERLKEELKRGREIQDAMREGFSRAWLSIRDSNISSLITAVVLYWLGTAAVRGFALTFGLGVLISMFTAITASRTFLFALRYKHTNRFTRFLFSNGFHI